MTVKVSLLVCAQLESVELDDVCPDVYDLYLMCHLINNIWSLEFVTALQHYLNYLNSARDFNMQMNQAVWQISQQLYRVQGQRKAGFKLVL